MIKYLPSIFCRLYLYQLEVFLWDNKVPVLFHHTDTATREEGKGCTRTVVKPLATVVYLEHNSHWGGSLLSIACTTLDWRELD